MTQPESQARRDNSEWVTHKETITNLFLKENKCLKGADGVVKTMERLYGFHKSPGEYERYFRKWNIRKNRNAREWEAVGRIVEARKAAGKDSVVRMNGEVLSETKLNKQIDRHSYTSSFRPYIQLPLPQIPMGFEVLTPRSDSEDLLSREEDTIQLPRVGVESSVPTYNLPFMEFQASIRLKEANRKLESGAALPNGLANGIDNGCLHPASFSAATESIESGVQAGVPLIYNSEHTEVSHELTQTYYATFFPKFRALLPISAQAKCSQNHLGMLPPLQSLTTAQVELLWFSAANNFAGLPDFPRGYLWNYVREHVSVSGLLQFSPGPTTIALAENLFQCIIECGDVQAAEFLLEKRYVNANKQVCIIYNYQYTPVERSAKLGNIPMTRLLVHYKADVNKTYAERYHPEKGALEHAVSPSTTAEPPLDLIHILLESGAIITIRLLETALSRLYLQLAETLIYKGAQDHHMEWTQRGIFLSALKQSDVDTAMRIVEIMFQVKANIAHSVTVHSETLNKSLWRDFSPRSVLDMAAEKGHLEVVRILLDSGIRLTEDTLTCAIRSTNMDLVLYLLHEDVNVDTVATLFRFPDTSGLQRWPLNDLFEFIRRTPYSEAIRSRNTQLIRLLKDKGALRHIHRNPEFKAALFASAEVGNLEIVRSLIRGVRGKEKELGCALFKACAAGHEKVAETLIAAGADADAPPENWLEGNSSLAEALKRKMTGLVQLLLNTGANANPVYDGRAYCQYMMTPLGIAVEHGDLSLIKDLLFAGARINPTANQDEIPALSLAIRSKKIEVIQLLLDNGADINHRHGHDTPLVASIESGVIEITDWLLELGADPADEDALLRAMSQSMDLVQRLLVSFSKRYPYGKGDYGSHALSQAVRVQDLPLVQALLEANIGVDWNWVDRKRFYEGETPLVIAIELNDQELVEMILSKVADLNKPVTYDGERRTALLVAVSVGHPQMIQLLISRGADLNLAATRGLNRTPLQMAAEKGRLEIVQLLIEKGAEVNALPAMKWGATALQLAAIGGYIGIAEELLRQGARVNAPGSDICGRTALEGAAEHGRIDMVQYLLNAGAEITQYATAMQYAKENGHEAICGLLESAAGSSGTALTLE